MVTAPALLPRPRLSTLIDLGLGLTRPSRRGSSGHPSRLPVLALLDHWYADLGDLHPRHGLTCACPLLAAAIAVGADYGDLAADHIDEGEIVNACLCLLSDHVGYSIAQVRIPWERLPPIAQRLFHAAGGYPTIALHALILRLYDDRLLGRHRIAGLLRELGY